MSAGIGWGWRVVKGGHTGATLYLTASLLSHKTASPGNGHRCHSYSLEGLLSVLLTGSYSSRPRMPTFALLNKFLASQQLLHRRNQKICATSQQGPYCQVRSSGVPPRNLTCPTDGAGEAKFSAVYPGSW